MSIEVEAIEAPVTRGTPYDELPLWLTVEEAAVLLNCSKWWVYEAVKRGDIAFKTFGRKCIKIPRDVVHPRVAQKTTTA